ncbi:unnamed protein product [Clonostachys chloroleuca]|uniref:Uncharacterized protein n=1 Tax=Clonostachys chloroleuca TaxID=1926264 RepID=A0AA35M3V7_9HYPO|nr:unnamed protein product [Clonostachys chloroleuca]
MHMNGFQDRIDNYNSRHVKWLDVTKRCSFGRGRSRLVEAVLEVDRVEYKALSAPIKISVRGDRSLSRVVGLADGGGWHANGKRGFANVVQADRFLSIEHQCQTGLMPDALRMLILLLGGSRLAIRVAPTPWFSRDEEMFNVGLRAQNCGGRRQGILEFDVSSKVRSKGRNIVFYSDAEG